MDNELPIESQEPIAENEEPNIDDQKVVLVLTEEPVAEKQSWWKSRPGLIEPNGGYDTKLVILQTNNNNRKKTPT